MEYFSVPSCIYYISGRQASSMNQTKRQASSVNVKSALLGHHINKKTELKIIEHSYYYYNQFLIYKSSKFRLHSQTQSLNTSRLGVDAVSPCIILLVALWKREVKFSELRVT